MSACSSGSSGGAGSSSSAGSSSGSPSSSSSGALDGKGFKVGIILPDTKSSQRWVTGDPQALAAGCKKANLSCDIQNANGDPAAMRTIAQGMENSGVKALMIVNLDAGSGSAIEKEADSKGITTIDYDRLTPGGNAALYISYDNTAVGTAQGEALVKCLQPARSQLTIVYRDGPVMISPGTSCAVSVRVRVHGCPKSAAVRATTCRHQVNYCCRGHMQQVGGERPVTAAESWRLPNGAPTPDRLALCYGDEHAGR